MKTASKDLVFMAKTTFFFKHICRKFSLSWFLSILNISEFYGKNGRGDDKSFSDMLIKINMFVMKDLCYNIMITIGEIS